MAELNEVVLPDIGDFKDVEVIEILVRPGDVIAPEDPLITLESDKASMEIPAPVAGTVAEVKVAVGDRLNKGDLILLLETEEGAAAPPDQVAAAPPAPDVLPEASTPCTV